MEMHAPVGSTQSSIGKGFSGLTLVLSKTVQTWSEYSRNDGKSCLRLCPKGTLNLSSYHLQMSLA